MSCRRCNDCEISYPPMIGKCHVCQEDTVYLPDGTPDPGWQDIVAWLNQDRRSAQDEQVRAWRHDVLDRLGFHGAELDMLVDAGVDLHRAEDLIVAGCAPATATRILL